MSRWINWVAAAVLLAMPASCLLAQIPGTPAVDPLAGGGAAAAPAAAPAASSGSSNLWSFLCPSASQKQACQNCLCGSQFGQLLNAGTAPLSLFTGGVIPGICPPSSAASQAGLAQPATSAEGAAARIKQSEADAKARRAAVRYLGTVDCHRWPEAEAALIHSLRADPNECVRWEAAIAFTNGCCCTKKTLEALTLTVSQSTKDGNPAENSYRILCAAKKALERCVSCYTDVGQENEPEKPEAPPKPEKPEAGSAAIAILMRHSDDDPERQALVRAVHDARRALAQAARRNDQDPFAPGQRDLYHVVATAGMTQPAANGPAQVRDAETPPPPVAAPTVPDPAPSVAPAAAPTELQPATSTSLAPKTGHRDLFSVFMNSMRPQ